MEKIVLEVEESVARKWQEASESKRIKVAAFISRIFCLEETRATDNESFLQMLNEVRKEVSYNGLNPQILGEIMEWDKETMKNLFSETHSNAR